MTTTEGHNRKIEGKLRGTWRRARLRAHLRGAALLVTWAIGLTLTTFLADWLFEMPFQGRLLLVATSLVILCTVFVRSWWRQLRKFNRKGTARKVEVAHPELLDLVTSYIEIADSAETVQGSDELKGIVHGQAADAAQPLNFSRIISMHTIRWVLAGAALSALIVVGVVRLLPTHARTFIERLQGQETRYPTKTQIVEVSGDRTVRQGDAFVLEATAGGKVPLTGRIQMRLTDYHWQSINLARKGEAEFPHRIDTLMHSFEYYYEIGDARSDIHRVTVVPPPGIVTAQVTMRPPKYTQVETVTYEKLNLEAPTGSELEWELELDTPLERVEVLFEKQEPIDAAISADGKTVRLSRRAMESGGYRFRWTRRDTGFVYEGLPHRIYVRPDAKPQITILKPAADIKGTKNNLLRCRFRVKDDYGIGEAWLVYSVNDGEEQRISLGQLPAQKGQEELKYPRYGVWTRTWQVRKSVEFLKVGDVIKYAIEVVDIRGLEPAMKRRTGMRKLTIVSRSDYQSHVLTQLTEIRRRFASLHLDARRSRQALAALLKGTRRGADKNEGDEGRDGT